MKEYIPIAAIVITAFSSFAQNSHSNRILVRHDTTLLKAKECEWIVKSLTKNNPTVTSEIGKPVSLIILDAIEKGKLKAFDPVTNKLIPTKEIFKWKMATDTVAVYDDAGIVHYTVVKQPHSLDLLNRVRVFQDWYIDISTGKFNSVIKSIELLEEIHTSSSGIFIGHLPLCRIYQ